MTPFRPCQALEQPVPTLHLSTSLPQDAIQQVREKLVHLHILLRLSLMRTKSDMTLKAGKERYEKHFDKSGRNLPIFRAGHHVYVDRHPTANTASERMANESR